MSDLLRSTPSGVVSQSITKHYIYWCGICTHTTSFNRKGAKWISGFNFEPLVLCHGFQKPALIFQV